MNDLLDYLSISRQRGASDLHLSAGAPAMVRINGQISALDDVVLDAVACRGLIMGAFSDTQRAKFERDWEIDFALNVDGVGRFRGNAHHSRGSAEAALRFIPSSPPALASLGHSHTVTEMCNYPHGLVLVAGVAGMGKTTTLAAMTQRFLTERAGVVVTIEDPIEYVFEHQRSIIKQRQIGVDTPSFASALRTAMRQDVNVIVVSEMRDLESIAAAITAAETGHLVISTIHARDSRGAVERIVDVFPAGQQEQIRTQLSGVLVGIISQRLMQRADAPGRVMATEVLVATPAVKNAIREQRTEQIHSLLQIGANHGMHTYDESLQHLAMNNFIHLDDALLYAKFPQELQEGFQRNLRAQAKKK